MSSNQQVVDSLIWLRIEDMVNDLRTKTLKLQLVNYLSGTQGSGSNIPHVWKIVLQFLIVDICISGKCHIIYWRLPHKNECVPMEACSAYTRKIAFSFDEESASLGGSRQCASTPNEREEV